MDWYRIVDDAAVERVEVPDSDSDDAVGSDWLRAGGSVGE